MLRGVEVLSPCVFVYTDPVCACRAVTRVSGSDGGRGGATGVLLFNRCGVDDGNQTSSGAKQRLTACVPGVTV